MTKIAQLSIFDRPRERILKNGPQGLKTEELLAILISSGNSKKDVFQLSSEVLKLILNTPDVIIDIKELMQLSGIKLAKAATIVAALELGKRIKKIKDDKTKTKILSPLDIFELLSEVFAAYDREVLIVCSLDVKLQVISYDIVSQGDISNITFLPKEIFKYPIKYNATAIILSHNHPSGDPSPSRNDILTTQKITEIAQQLGITILDHIICSNTSLYSFKEEKITKVLSR